MVSAPVIYIGISLLALALIVVILIYTNRIEPKKKPSKLAQIALLFVIMGVIFGDDRLISYSLIGVGVVLSIYDIIRDRRK